MFGSPAFQFSQPSGFPVDIQTNLKQFTKLEHYHLRGKYRDPPKYLWPLTCPPRPGQSRWSRSAHGPVRCFLCGPPIFSGPVLRISRSWLRLLKGPTLPPGQEMNVDGRATTCPIYLQFCMLTKSRFFPRWKLGRIRTSLAT